MRSSILVALLLAATPTRAVGPTLQIRPAKVQVLVGEPLLIIGHETGTGARLRDISSGLRVLVDKGAGLRPLAPSLAVSGGGGGGATIGPGGLVFEVVVIFDRLANDGQGEWAFPTPGQYRVALEQGDSNGVVARSNAITVSVVSPTGDDAAVFAQIESDPEAKRWLSYQDLGGLLPESLRPLAQAHPTSTYLRRALYRDLETRAIVAQSGCDAAAPGPCTVEPGDLAAAVKRQNARLCSRALALAEVQDEWLPPILRVLARLQRAAEDPRGDATLRRLARDFGDRAAGRWASEQVDP
jgi:hypothetical protein